MPALAVPTHQKLRTDIQALRGFAVLIVLVYHAGLGLLPGGYLGVDVFFVISGFLITRMLKESIEAGTFSFTEFYWRRAKRLLPAAFTTFLAVALAAPLLLTAIELEELKRQLVGAILFAGNIALWLQSGYFSEAAEAKPLLHVWSLAIEEQYYLLLPAALVLAPRKWWLPGAITLGALSLFLCLWLAPIKPSATFYLLPTRAWELIIGSVGALAVIGTAARRLCGRLLPVAVLVLLGLAARPLGGAHPGIDALIACTATLVIILARNEALERMRPMRLLARVGDFSYSLYLVHWPLFAFLNAVSVGGVPAGLRLGALAASFVLGYLLFALVETPCRRIEVRWRARKLSAVVASSSLVVLAPLLLLPAGMSSGGSEASYSHLRRHNHGLGFACEFTGPFDGRAECRTAEAPETLVWGDSVAMHLVPGLVRLGVPLAQATMSYCGPLLGMAPIEGKARSHYKRAWAEQCLAFNDTVLDYVARTPSIKTVVISSFLGQYLAQSGNSALVRLADGTHEASARADLAVAGLERTVAALRALGKRVVLVAPPPVAPFSAGKCLERLATGKPIVGPHGDCVINVTEDARRGQGVLALLDRLAGSGLVGIVSFDDLLCAGGRCATRLEGVLLYRDENHFSHAGSALVAERMDLARTIERAAR